MIEVETFTKVLLKAAEILFLLPKGQEEEVKNDTGKHLKIAVLILKALLVSGAHSKVMAQAIQDSLLEVSLKIKLTCSTVDINACIGLV